MVASAPAEMLVPPPPVAARRPRRAPPRAPRAGGARARRHRAVWVVLGCVGVAAASLALSRELSFDAWGWMLWGRELATGHPAFSTADYPSWKPLPALVSTAASLLSTGAAPVAWLVVERAGALAALVFGWRIAARLGGPLAGALAVVSLVLAPHWIDDSAMGVVEPLVAGLVLAAVDAYLRGRGRTVLVLLWLVALARVEVWPILAVVAVWRWRTAPRDRPLVAGLVASVGVVWFGGDWLGSGSPFTGGSLARESSEAVQPPVGVVGALLVLWRALLLVIAPVTAAALAGLVVAVRRRRRDLVAVGSAAVAWVLITAVMRVLGYAGLSRFMVPVAAVVCAFGA